MLKELHLANFKSFAAGADPIPFAPVTILVGANASGKSNVFDAIRFLQGIGMGLSIAEILTGKWEGGREIQPGLRGGAEEACWTGADIFSLRAKLELWAENKSRRDSDGQSYVSPVRRTFEHEIICRPKPESLVESESLSYRILPSSWQI